MPRKRSKEKDKVKQSDGEGPPLVDLPPEELHPFTLDDMGTLLVPRFRPLPEVGRLSGKSIKKRMESTLAAFADLTLQASGYFDASPQAGFNYKLLILAQELEKQSKENSRTATSAYHEACKTLEFPSSWTTIQVMNELRERYRDNNHQPLSQAERDLGFKTQWAHQARDVDNGVNAVCGVLSEFKDQLPPGLTFATIDKCSELLRDMLEKLKQPPKDRKVEFFPDGESWKPILNSFYLYSFGGIIYEAQMIDQEIVFTKKEGAPGSTSVTMVQLIEHHRTVLKGGNGNNSIISLKRFNLRKAVCKEMRNARLLLHREGLSKEEQLDKIKRARESIAEWCGEFQKFEAAVPEARHTLSNEPCRAHRASQPHIPPSASLAHIPVSRRLIDN